MRSNFIILLIIFFIFSGCSDEAPPEPETGSGPTTFPEKSIVIGCRACHGDIVPDQAHALSCTACHGGKDMVADKNSAHNGLVAHPAHPEHMEASCGSCHHSKVNAANNDVHFTLSGLINQTRAHFGAADQLSSLTRIPVHETVDTLPKLADDMLRRRCLRCHPYSSGDAYPYVSRGIGCAACHMEFSDGSPVNHQFIKPRDRQCLSCHYGNYVGSDYYGKFEQDYNWEYRTPYVTRHEYMRPYGVERYNLSPDIHQLKGLICADCHTSDGHDSGEELKCTSCHEAQANNTNPGVRLALTHENNVVYLKGKKDGRLHEVPQLTNPAHTQYGLTVSCQVCHAQWSYNDSTTHLIRTELDDYDQWERLTVQGSSEVETVLEHNLYSEDEEIPPAMKDGITEEPFPGIWFKGFTQRRWEEMIIRKDTDGIIKVFRPILDLRLSMVTEDEEVLFDNVGGKPNGLKPYTPHTTGHAGIFYTNRFLHLLQDTNSDPTK